jgi:hypothetical protein
MITKAAAQAQIDEATERFLGECAGASDAQWLFRPAATQWSMWPRHAGTRAFGS